jgi:hypothetical protein
MQVNIWIALRNGAHIAIKERVQWDEDRDGPYAGPVPNWVGRMFETIADRATVEKLFRRDRVWFSQGAVWRDWDLWSLNFDESRENLQLLGEKLADLELAYPSMVRVVGAWWWDGRQVGTRFDANGDVVGTPTYPLDARLIEFMPDLDDQGTRPTEMGDVNLVFGQSPRRFS